MVDGTTGTVGSAGAFTSGTGGDGTTSSAGSTGGAGDTSSATTGSGGVGGGVMMPVVCSAQNGMGCADGEFCSYQDNQCGMGAVNGACTKRPKVCPPDLPGNPPELACGCDAELHASSCWTRHDGTDLSVTHLCATPVGMFACGGLFCTIGQAYCKHAVFDQGGSETTSCVHLPDCGATCDCLLSTTCGSTCGGTPEGGIEVFCPSGG